MNNTIDPRNPPEHIYRVPAYYRSRFGRMEPRVRIGATYAPKIVITPAVERPTPAEPSVLRQVVLGAGMVLAFGALIGITHMIFGG